MSFRIPPSEVRAMSIRERRNWVIRALDRLAARERLRNG